MKLYGLDIATQWNEICELHVLKLAELYHPDWYRWRLTNNYERAVFLKGDPVLPRESARYRYIADKLLPGSILEIGCSTGYGIQFLPDQDYTGIDYDKIIVEVAKDQDWKDNAQFKHADINKFDGFYDNIIAFEVIEHLDNGLDIVQKLKGMCKKLLISVPWNEPVGFWGEHHKLHGLNESHFDGFTFLYIDQFGNLSDVPREIGPDNQCNLMICIYE